MIRCLGLARISDMKRALASLGLAAAIASPASGQDGSYGKYEAPSYSVEAQIGDAEIRRYDPQTLAMVTVSGGQRDALNRGFRALAGYIFGGNAGGQSIAMTSPVTQTAPTDGVSTVTFMVPRAWSVDTLPQPNNRAVAFREVAERRMLVLTFSGRAGPSILAAREAELREIATQAGLTLVGGAEYAFYDDPFTMPWTRRNEVAFEIAGT